MTNTTSEQLPAKIEITDPFYVVGIGASAGGLEALERLFANMPTDTGMAFVVVQHLSPDFKSLMNELLARHTKIPIYRVENEMRIEPNGIYLTPAKKDMILSDGKLLLTDQDASGGLNLPIDIFFRSLAKDAGKRAVAVVLSGTGSDGSRGLEDIHEAGGLVMVQDMQTAGFDGMPRSAIATGTVNVVAPPELLPDRLCCYIADPENFPRHEPEVEVPLMPGTELAAIFRLFRSRYGIDFTLYREKTIHRRIERRIQLVGATNLSTYVHLLLEDDQELELLYRDLLVEVTQFFRDPQAFQRLSDEILPQIVREATGPHDEIRVWVPGCATGEEAYTIAILLDVAARNAVDDNPRMKEPQIKVFATDVHRNSLEIASSGVYSAEAVAGVPADLLERYFTHHSSLFHINRELRKLVVFAPHDITKDPPFTKVDLISCRNVLIYLEPNVQRRVLSLFHFGLKVGGTMLLGPSESLGDLNSEFDTVDQHWRLFRKLRDVRLPEASTVRLATPLFNVVRGKAALPVGNQLGGTSQTGYIERTVLEDLLDRYVPPSFLVNSSHELVHSFGDARRLLVQPKGRPTLEILKMVEGDLRMAISSAIHRTTRGKERVVLDGVRIASADGDKLARVIAEPYLKKNQDLYLISIEEIRQAPARFEPGAETFRVDDESAQRIIDLEHELEFNKESLQTTVEELESSNEELQSTNEELVAANEELQSTNEELHSVNEELYTVNAEHQRKISELSQLTADMDNLMRSTEIGTIFLDRDLCIRRFTPAISTAFNVLEQDIGRPIDQFAYHFESPGWLEKAKEVIQTGESSEVELRARGNDKVYLKRIRPYRVSDGPISGIVITFTDVTALSKAEEERAQREHLERITRDLQDFAYAVSHDLHAPTRQIAECIERIKANHEEQDEGDTSKLISHSQIRIRKLKSMLDRLLEYSRINTRGQVFENVNLEVVLSEVARELQIAEGDIELTFDSLPVVRADPIQIRRVFWHLLDNAMKYSEASPTAIHVGAIEADGHWQISVRDNGIGIKKNKIEEIFSMFRRLEEKETLGEGVGLTLCRRIMERHGGEIWAESSSHGSTLYLRLPRMEEM